MASLQNFAGVYTQPDETNVTVALAYATGRGDGTFALNFKGPDPRAYFPSTYSYVLAQTTGFDPGKGATLARFLCYAVSKGQTDAVPLKYARLSSEIVDIAIDAIVRIPGAPSKAACPVAGAPPPPPPITVVGGGGHGPGTGNGFVSSGQGPGGTAAGTGGSSTGATTGGTGAAANRVTTRGRRVLVGNGLVPGQLQDSTTTTISAKIIDQQFADAAGGRKSGSKPVSAMWLLLAGVAAAWAVSFVLARRRPA